MNEKTMTAFLRAVKVAAHELRYDVFCAVEAANGVGYVAYSNEGSATIRKFAEEANDLNQAE